MTRRIDRYELLEPVGSGGMSVVYRGRDTALDRVVAVKLLHPHLAARPDSRARFSREARAVARLHHPNIVEIYDYAGDAAVESYLVTEFVPGRTLRAFADQEGVRFPEIGALLVRALADALAHAHAAGVIHRDLKPENVLVLEEAGRRAVKLVDFGIARILASDERMTLTGALVGSPNHMAPEIVEGREADARSDVFSLGTILYWLATGRMPFEASNPTATLRRVISGEYADPRQVSPLVSDALAGVVSRAMAADPAERTPSAAALRDALDAALAASGLPDAAAELEAFLADPPGYTAALRGRLAAAALAQADAALARGETAAGMRLLDRVLALDPGDGRVEARLARVAAAARWRRLARRGAVAVLLALVLGAAAVAVVRHRPGAPTPPAEAPITSALAERGGASRPGARTDPTPAQPTPAAVASDHRQEPSAARTERAVPSAGAGPALPPAIVELHVRPYAQRALLDGVEVAQGEARITLDLVRGATHRLQVEHACCFPFVREFPASEALPERLELKVPLQPRPARLRVEGDPAARVFVEGRLVGTAGDSQRAPLEVEVPSHGATPYEAVAALRVEAEGRPPLRGTVRLRAGTDVTFAATDASPAAPVAGGEAR